MLLSRTETLFYVAEGHQLRRPQQSRPYRFCQVPPVAPFLVQFAIQHYEHQSVAGSREQSDRRYNHSLPLGLYWWDLAPDLRAAPSRSTSCHACSIYLMALRRSIYLKMTFDFLWTFVPPVWLQTY